MQAWPRLVSSLPPLTRLDGSIQFGLDPSTGIRLTGLTETEVSWIRELDGGHDPLREGRRLGLQESRLTAILRALRDHDLLAEAAGVGARSHDHRAEGRPERRAAARVWVQGRGLTSARLADLLRADGVGKVERFAQPDDTRGQRRNPSLAFLVSETPVSGAQARAWLGRRIPHLPVVVTARSATVGPLILADGSPCLRCVELGRTARDPSWRTLAAQSEIHAAGEISAADDGLGAIAAGLAATIARAFLDGRPPARGVAIDIGSPWPSTRQHRWSAHPDCAACCAKA